MRTFVKKKVNAIVINQGARPMVDRADCKTRQNLKVCTCFGIVGLINISIVLGP